jgi:hypothetical protein
LPPQRWWHSVPIFDSTDTTQLGTDQGACIRITKFRNNKTGSWECEWTTFLNDGTDSITVETPFYDTGLGVGAITGGTGACVGKRLARPQLL